MEGNNHETTLGTVGGTLTTIVGVLDMQDLVKTAILAMVGAVVSFIVSSVLQRIFKKDKDQ